MKNGASITAGTLLGIVAAIHLLRLFYPFTLIVGNYSVPLWLNAVGFIIAGFLSFWLFRSIRR